MDFNLDEIYLAQKRLEGIIRKTPIMPFNFASNVLDANIKIKCENHQTTGSFKIRGAANKISKISDNLEEDELIVTASAGNHAQGVSSAATKCGKKAKVIMPNSAPLAKIDAVKSYGGDVELYGDSFDEAYEYAKNIKGTFMHPYNDYDIIAGQGTIGLEILNDFPDVDVVLVPAGGGGLLSGISYAIKSVKPSVEVIGVQAQNANAIAQSFSKKTKVVCETSSTIADGISVACPGDKCIEIINKYTDDVITVGDGKIAAAMIYLLERCKQVVEPAGATSVAALFDSGNRFKGKNVCCVLSGGNVDMNTLGNIIDQGMYARYRKAEFACQIENNAKRVNEFIQVFIETGANILYYSMDRIPEHYDIAYQRIFVTCEIRGEKHYKTILSKLKDGNFNLINV